MLKLPATVIDTNGQRYELLSKIGGGGQGDVYSTKNGRFAVKVLHASGARSRNALQNKVARLRQLDLDGISIARPLATLREPHAGYVMKMLDGMASLSSLSVVDPKASSPLSWYLDSGGLVRRLRALAATADALNMLHSRGLAYGDFSPNNVLISGDPSSPSVYLIDPDNLRQESSPGSSVYTPRFGAPELVRLEAGPSSSTDAHAFAVTAFEVLCVTHPLLGDDVVDGDPECEMVALEGRLPWVDHPTDRSNESSTGLPREIVLSQRLRDAFNDAFTHGLEDAVKRPRLSKWAEYLHAAADATLSCPSCGSSYYHPNNGCPWCGAPRPPFVLAKSRVYDSRFDADEHSPAGVEAVGHPFHHLAGRWEPNGRFIPRNLAGLCVAQGASAALTVRHANHNLSGDAGAAVATLSLGGHRLTITPCGDGLALENCSTGKLKDLADSPTTITVAPGESAWVLHLGCDAEAHRVVFFTLVEGAG